MPKGTDSLALAGGCAVCFVGALIVDDLAPPLPGDWPAAYGVYRASLTSAAAYVLYFQLIRIAGPVYMSQVGYIVVTVGVVAGMLVLEERHSAWVWAGIGLMLAGVTMVNIGQRFAVRQARANAFSPFRPAKSR